MKGKRIVIPFALFVLLFMACVCSPSAILNLGKKAEALKATATAMISEVEETFTAEEPSPAPPAKEKTPSPKKKCFADIPLFPGAKRDQQKEAELDKWLRQIGMGGALVPTEEEARIYITGESPAKVIAFYRKEMPKKGWKKSVEFSTEEGGIIIWEKGPIEAGLLTGQSEGETLILIGCGPKKAKEKAPRPSVTPEVPSGPPGSSRPPEGEGLLPTPPFSQGLAGWDIWIQPGSRVRGNNEVHLVDDPTYGKVVEFTRANGDSDGGGAGIVQKLNLDVSGYPHLYVWLVGKVLREEGGNLAGRNPKWFPEGALQVRIRYLTAAGQEREWYHGFYAKSISRADTEHFTRVPLGEWFTYVSPDLQALPDPPVRILEFKVYGFGWNFRGQVAQVELIGAFAEVTGAEKTIPVSTPESRPGITAREGYILAEKKAREWNPKAALLSASAEYKFDVPLDKIGSIVGLDGRAVEWEYRFIIADAQTEAEKHRWFFVTVSGKGIEAFEEGFLAIPPTSTGSVNDWVLDSPDAIRIAEENGGARFREEYPDVLIEAKLDLTGPFLGYSDTTKNVKWTIKYCLRNNFMQCKHFEIDGTTGQVVAIK